MIILYYLAAFIFSCILILMLFIQWDKKVYSYFSNIFWIGFIANIGYLSLALAETLEKAVLAKQLCYVGGCFIPIIVFFNIVHLCKIKIPRVCSGLMWTYAVGVFLCVLTIGKLNIFYISYNLKQIGNVAVLEKVNGPAYYLYLVELIVFNMASIVIVLKSLRKKHRKKVSYINSVLLLIPLVVSTLVYILQRKLDFIIDWIPLSYVIFIIMFYIVYRRVEKYDIASLVLDSFEQEETRGYIIINKWGNYIGCSKIAIKYYPILENLYIDYKLDNNNELFKKINKEMHNLKENSSITWHYAVEDKDLKFEMRYNYYRGHQNGYIIEISDDTVQQQYIKLLNNYNNELEDAVKNKTEHIQDIQNKIIIGIANVVESRDNSTGGHIKRTSDVVRIFIKQLKKENLNLEISETFYNHLIKAAPMHDIGKIAIDDAILRKPGKYTTEEYEIMKTHSYEGSKIIDDVLADVEDEKFVDIARNVAHFHHEKFDGNGYPNKLSGEEIPLEARIMAIADVFDALVSKRCYKEKMSYDEAFSIIKESCGNHFDPKLGEVFLKCRKDLELYYNGIE